MRIQAVGDSAVRVGFPGEISEEMNANIRGFCRKLEEAAIRGVIEWVPAYQSVTVYYDPHYIGYREMKQNIAEVGAGEIPEAGIESRLIHVPVQYGGDSGPDLYRVARENGLQPEEVIEIHQQPEYLIYMLGFLPGFPYLGGLDQRIATPRLQEPRPKIDPGSVGIAHGQTGVYPIASPGGWNLIGKTPLKLFQLEKGKQGFFLQAGDRVKFFSISALEFKQVEEQVEMGTYVVHTEGSEGNATD
ncbi:5-oxoprolinase subunit PxpB [Virgibacillus xinjiangensis]|uniref:5-oxoprolinase subunit PxpB n=1 Tax=Virgibacillus xinjiangensis TaxID=393090 RepID=A0ABV7CZF3_9BACI